MTMQPSDRDTTNARVPDLSARVIGLLKGVQYREQDERAWSDLLALQAHVRDYVKVLNLDLVLDEAEGYAFLKSHPEPVDENAPHLPRLVARRPLSFPVSLLLALLRKKLAELDAGGGDTRLILARREIIELVRLFLPESSNEARLTDQIDATINKVIELGFLRRLKATDGAAGSPAFEVRRILKAFVDGQWLADFDAQLAAYRTTVMPDATGTDDDA